MKRRAFTLIELLVVISIIALLIALLLPALSKARASARALQCASSQRQCGVLIHMYTQEQKDYFPQSTAFYDENFNYLGPGVQSLAHLSWSSRLVTAGLLPPLADLWQKELWYKNDSIRWCPEIVGDKPGLLANSEINNVSQHAHFMINRELSGYTAAATGITNATRARRTSEVQHHSGVFVLTDGTYNRASATTPRYTISSQSILPASYNSWKLNPGGANGNGARYLPGSTSTGSVNNPASWEGFRHAHGANFTFIDGHTNLRSWGSNPVYEPVATAYNTAEIPWGRITIADHLP